MAPRKLAGVSGDTNAAVLNERMRIAAIVESAEGKRNPNLRLSWRFVRPWTWTRREHFSARCQSALEWDPLSASKRDPFDRRVLLVALAASELAGVAETARARVV